MANKFEIHNLLIMISFLYSDFGLLSSNKWLKNIGLKVV